MAEGMMLLGFALAAAAPAAGQQLVRVASAPAALKRLPMVVVGRVQPRPDGGVVRQWPGTYFETAASGPAAFVRIGAGKVSLRLTVDGGAPVALVAPAPGTYRIQGLGSGHHRLRIDVASESQSAPTEFGGFFAAPGTVAAPLRHRRRAIEFIGDSHTVGYGNTSPGRACTEDQVWATTDTSRGIAPLTAARYAADYQVNAISGRGVVRNYNGFAAATLPEAYPFTLLNGTLPARTPGWHPQVIVIAVGTNDFSTALNPGERWATRDALHADFEATYVRFVQQLRARNPQAHVVLWATDMANGEIQAEAGKVVDRLRRSGDSRIGFVPVSDLAFSACNAHPDLADDARIADALSRYIDAQPGIWGVPPGRRGSPIRRAGK